MVCSGVVLVPPQCQYDEARRMYDRAIHTWEKLQDPQLQDVLVSEADMFMEQVRNLKRPGGDLS